MTGPSTSVLDLLRAGTIRVGEPIVIRTVPVEVASPKLMLPLRIVRPSARTQAVRSTAEDR